VNGSADDGVAASMGSFADPRPGVQILDNGTIWRKVDSTDVFVLDTPHGKPSGLICSGRPQ
jgi:hypothetical protein